MSLEEGGSGNFEIFMGGLSQFAEKFNGDCAHHKRYMRSLRKKYRHAGILGALSNHSERGTIVAIWLCAVAI